MGFGLVALGVGSRRGVPAVDEAVWRFFAKDSNESLETLARAVTVLGAGLPLAVIALCAGIVMWGWQRSVVLAVAPWVAAQASVIIVSGAKVGFGAERPPLDDQVVRTLSPAFPSGHSGNMAAVATVTVLVWANLAPSRRARRASAAGGVACTGLVAWSRLELNVHWFSDVVGGMLLGYVVGSLVAMVCLRAHGRADRAWNPMGR